MTENSSAPRITLQQLKDPVNFLAFGLGSGMARKAPGTWGTLVGLLLYLPMQSLSLWPFLILILCSFIAGIYICEHASKALGVHDHGGIVWDEFVGLWITFIAVPEGWGWLLLGFVLFRVFDIWKPWPIGWADKKVSGGLGIMLDDVLAGFWALIVLQLTSVIIL